MKSFRLLFILFIVGIGCISLQSCFNEAKAGQVNTTPDGKIAWNKIQDLEQIQKENPKKVIIDVYTDWCKWCHVMDDKTFTNPDLKEFLLSEYHLVKLNGENKSKLQFKGQQYEFVAGGRRGYNQLAATLLKGNLAYPSFVVMDENLEVVQVIRGYKDAAGFRAALATN